MGNIDGHAKVSHNNVFAFPNVYGKNCFWNWPGWFPLPGYEESFYENACIMDAGQNYITLPNGNGWKGNGGAGCSFKDAESIKVHTHSNKVYGPNGDVHVSGCTGSSADTVDQLSTQRSVTAGTGCRLFNNTDCSSGHDLGPLPGPVTANAEACADECAKNCACAVGVWGKAGDVHRCYLKSRLAQLGAVGAYAP